MVRRMRPGFLFYSAVRDDLRSDFLRLRGRIHDWALRWIMDPRLSRSSHGGWGLFCPSYMAERLFSCGFGRASHGDFFFFFLFF